MSGPVTVPKSLKLRHYLSPEFLSPAIFVPQRDTWVCWSRIRLGRDQKLCLGLKSKPHTPISSFFPQESSRIGYPMLNQVLIKLHRRSSFNWLPCNQLLIDHCFSFPLKNMGPDVQNMLNAQGCWNSCAAKYLCTSLVGWAACLYGSLGGTNVPEHLGQVLSLLTRCMLIQFSKCGGDPAATILPWELVVVQSLSHVLLLATPWNATRQASLSFTISQSLLKLTSVESAMPSNHLSLCRSLLLLPSVFPSIRVFSKELALCIRWPKYWSFSFSISTSPSKE